MVGNNSIDENIDKKKAEIFKMEKKDISRKKSY